jgi:hypothetical protein
MRREKLSSNNLKNNLEHLEAYFALQMRAQTHFQREVMRKCDTIFKEFFIIYEKLK